MRKFALLLAFALPFSSSADEKMVRTYTDSTVASRFEYALTTAEIPYDTVDNPEGGKTFTIDKKAFEKRPHQVAEFETWLKKSLQQTR